MVSPETKPDTESPSLIAQARAGDGDSFWELCGPLQDRVFRQAMALCREEFQARDLTQETMIEAWKSIHRYNGSCRLATWLCSILLHRHQTHLRRSRWKSALQLFSFENGETTLERVKDPNPGPDKSAEISEQAHLILGSLDKLSARHREVIFLRFYADESLEGMASVLNCSIGTVKSRLFNALENLRKLRIYREEMK
ncbi:MAG: polymerase sigma factor, sigma-70 family [Verrucomicrobiales bacterium]|nr:polymerase sigma factor, sigma-70 family [Verrucomicrobiales bacterium]